MLHVTKCNLRDSQIRPVIYIRARDPLTIFTIYKSTAINYPLKRHKSAKLRQKCFVIYLSHNFTRFFTGGDVKVSETQAKKNSSND